MTEQRPIEHVQEDSHLNGIQKENQKKNRNKIFGIPEVVYRGIEIVFFITVIICTVVNLNITKQQQRLIFKPVVGVVNVKPTYVIKDQNLGSKYDNLVGVKFDFVIKNVGNLPAKNVILNVKGMIGKTVLPKVESEPNDGIVLIQDTEVTNTRTIDDRVLHRLVHEEEELVFTIDINYTDWEEFDNYSFSNKYKITVESKDPLKLSTTLIPSNSETT
jgi:hypothetical protein